MRAVKAAISSLAIALAAVSVAAETSIVVGPKGQRISVIADVPQGDGRFSAVVLAPGQGYHMELPAMEAVSRAMTAQGIAVFRFNWSYFTSEPKGQPSDDLSKELQDLRAVLAMARSHPKIASERISVAGKSLGSVVAWQALAGDPKLRGALLLTPICSRVGKDETVPREEARENYPGFEAERRRTLWISGDKDPLCAPTVLYEFAKARGDSARVAVVGGDHSYESRALPSAAAEVALKRSLSAVSALSVGFVGEISGP